MKYNYRQIFIVIVISFFIGACSMILKNRNEGEFSVNLAIIDKGWSQNSVNATIFRKNSIVSSLNYQFVAYYDSSAHVVIARRRHNKDNWEVYQTPYSGNVCDAHNVISLMVDEEGFLHMCWDHHNNPLHYCHSLEPEGLKLSDPEAMVGEDESFVSYPEFYRMEDGGMLFAYRDGGSGNGNFILNRYDLNTKRWTRLHSNLIDGEGKRNAYWQMHVDKAGTIHLSWVWRETPDVRSNHDMCYACSKDGGYTWMKSTGELYELPINLQTAEIVQAIPQGSNLINQTSMTADERGNPFIATYYKADDDSCIQYHIIFKQNGSWNSSVVTKRTLDFELGGLGSRSIPISRPQLLMMKREKNEYLVMVYRDQEIENNVILATSLLGKELNWTYLVISPYPVDRWEPSFDSEMLWNYNKLHLYFQKVGQGQGESNVTMSAQPVGVLEVEIE